MEGTAECQLLNIFITWFELMNIQCHNQGKTFFSGPLCNIDIADRPLCMDLASKDGEEKQHRSQTPGEQHAVNS